MLTSAKPVYLDSSGLVKLVLREAESEELERYLRAHPTRVSCALARVEVLRAVWRYGQQHLIRATNVLRGVLLLPLDALLLESAARQAPATLRSLDAIHLAAAQTLGRDLESLVTYDHRMSEAALALGFRVDAPGT